MNNMTETKLRQLFDTGHGKKGEETKVVPEITEEEEAEDDLKDEEAATDRATVFPRAHLPQRRRPSRPPKTDAPERR